MDKYLSYDAFVVHVEAELSQAISTKRHLWCLTAFRQELDIEKGREVHKVDVSH